VKSAKRGYAERRLATNATGRFMVSSRISVNRYRKEISLLSTFALFLAAIA
jgi:hypothetical protein